jgi:hypothetical protein
MQMAIENYWGPNEKPILSIPNHGWNWIIIIDPWVPCHIHHLIFVIVLLGSAPTRDKVPRIGFLGFGIVHKNVGFRLVEPMQQVLWSERFTQEEVFFFP